MNVKKSKNQVGSLTLDQLGRQRKIIILERGKKEGKELAEKGGEGRILDKYLRESAGASGVPAKEVVLVKRARPEKLRARKKRANTHTQKTLRGA